MERRHKKPKPPIGRDNEGNVKQNKKQKKMEKNQSNILLYSVIFTLFNLIIGYQLLQSSYKTNSLDKFAYSFGFHENLFVIIMDAGSTASRLRVTSFYKSVFSGKVKLHNDVFIEIKPGLSSYAENPAEGAAEIGKLLDMAKEHIPKLLWDSTPVALRATAGLRLLSDDKVENILSEVKKVVEKSPFYSNENSVTIMDGIEEGIFSWFTVNFILDGLEDLSKSVATFDLGGGSVQVTYVPKSGSNTFKKTKYIHTVSILGHNINAYSYSYLGLGLNAARSEIFLQENDIKENISSSCVSSSINDYIWTYNKKKYHISGKQSDKPSVDIQACKEIVKNVIDQHKMDQPEDLLEFKIFAFSYFFDIIEQSRLIDSQDEQATVTVGNIKLTARTNCEIPAADKPFLCADLIFIATLLEHGFGLKSDVSLNLVDKIDSYDISWALGAAFSILENGL